MLEYNWQGNVRELENVIERAIILTDAKEIRTEHLPEFITNPKYTLDDKICQFLMLKLKWRKSKL